MKTWKREAGAVLITTMLVLLALNKIALLEVVVWPFTTFAGAAFGADWWSKRRLNKEE